MASQHDSQKPKKPRIERVQLGVRMEKNLVKVLKAMAEYHDISLGALLEGIVLFAFEGQSPFTEEAIGHIKRLKDIYGMDYDSSASDMLHQPGEESDDEA